MNRRHPTRTSVAALSLALQAFGWGFAPLADARLESVAARASVHVEAGAGAACEPGHDHATCTLCHYAGARWFASSERATPLLSLATVGSSGLADPDVPPHGFRSPNPSRAPPPS